MVGEVFKAVLNADVMTRQQMPEQSKHQNSGEGFKEVFDEALEKIKKGGDYNDPDTNATSIKGLGTN